MKKLLTACAACVLAGMVSAQVESVNVVGYSTVDLTANTYRMIATQFENVGQEGGIPLNDLLVGDIPYGTKIQILQANGQIYDIYTYLAEAYDPIADDFVPGWGDGSEELAVNPIVTGQAFWIMAPSACSVTVAGEVLVDSGKTINVLGGQYSMISNPYPAPVNLNDLTWTGLTYGDKVQVLQDNGQIYDIYTYLAEAYDPIADDFVPGWGDGSEELMSTPVPVGKGFWIKPVGNVTVTFASPL